MQVRAAKEPTPQLKSRVAKGLPTGRSVTNPADKNRVGCYLCTKPIRSISAFFAAASTEARL